MNILKQMLLNDSLTVSEDSDNKTSELAKSLISEWSEPPTPLEVLVVMGLCTREGAGQSVMVTLDIIFREALEQAGQTKEEVIAEAKVAWGL